MAIPLVPPDDVGGPPGWSYAGVLVHAAREPLLAVLRDLKATVWVGPDEDSWVVVAAAGKGPVAADGRGVAALASQASRTLECVALDTTVVDDRLLLFGAWDRGEDLGRYVSDPSVGAPDPDDVFPEPEGAWHAGAYAWACGRPEAAVELEEVLGEVLDPDSVIESERLARVLGLLGAPSWVVSASSLPRDVPAGPAAHEVTRLGSGRTGLQGRVAGGLKGTVRRRRRFSH
jgi:hypothetical protein